jgi:hypothetical protein
MSQPEKIFDLSTDSWVDNPELVTENKEETKPEETEEEEEDTEEEDSDEEIEEDKPKGKKEEKKEEESEDESEDGSEEEEEEESDEAEDEKSVTPDAYVESAYGEKWGVKTEAELEKLVENSINLVSDYDKLKKDHDALKADSGKPKFESEAEERAFNLIKKFDPKMQGEALITYAKLIGMDDIDNLDGRLALEEKYIHEHPELTRDEAQRKFSREYTKKYSPKKEDFDTDEEYDEEMEMLKLDMKSDVAKARTFLKEKQKEFKPKAVEDKSKVSEVVTKSIEKNATELTSFIDKTNELVFEHDGDKYTFKLDADKKKRILETVNAWVNNPSSYDKDGVLIGVKGKDEMLNIAAGGMFMKDIISAITGQVKNSANIKRVDEINKKKPKARKAPGGGDIMGDDLDAQAMRLIKKNKAA